MRSSAEPSSRAPAIAATALLLLFAVSTADEDTLLAHEEDKKEREADTVDAKPLTPPVEFAHFRTLRRQWGRAVSVLPRTTRVGWLGSGDLAAAFVRTLLAKGYNVTAGDRCFGLPGVGLRCAWGSADNLVALEKRTY